MIVMKHVGNSNRCPWVDLSKPDYVEYHDKEWGVPEYTTTDSSSSSWFLKGAGLTSLEDDPQEAQELPAGIRSVRSGHNRQLRSEEAEEPAGQCRYRPQSLEDRSRHRECQAISRRASRPWHVCDYIWRFVDHTPKTTPSALAGLSRHHPRIGRHEQGPEAGAASSSSAGPSATPTCRRRHGQRSPRRLLSSPTVDRRASRRKSNRSNYERQSMI